MPAVRATEAPLPVAAAASAQRSMCDARGVGAASPAAREGEERAPGRAPRPGAASSRRRSFEAVLRSALPQKSCPRWLRPLPRETRATRVLAVGARLVRLVQTERAHLGCGASAQGAGSPLQSLSLRSSGRSSTCLALPRVNC